MKDACDTHMHIFAVGTGPPDANVAAYRKVAQRLGTDRAVVVQPNGYGLDNTVTVAAIAELGADRTRGIATVDASVSDEELERLTNAGIRGARLHMLPGGPLTWDAVEPVAARVVPFGWHSQVQMDGRLLADREAQLARLPGTLVIDHVGKFLEPVGVDHPGFRALMRLLANGRTWLKLSAAYETSRSGPPHYDDVGVLATAAARAFPERMLWASNWPHVSVQPPPDDAWQLDMLHAWVPDPAVRRRILVENPAELYGFV